MKIEAIWQRIDSWLTSNGIEAHVRLLPGAKKEDIQKIEKTVEVALPKAIKDSWQIHNGQHGLATALVPPWEILSDEGIMRFWNRMQKLMADGVFDETQAIAIGPVQAVWWHAAWVPLAHNGAGDLLCADMAPAKNGRKGQIITVWHVREQREVIADSFVEWLNSFADDLEQGRYQVSGEELIRVE